MKMKAQIMEQLPESQLVPLAGATVMLGNVSQATVYNMRKRGEIKLIKVGGRTMVPISEIQRIVSGRKSMKGNAQP